MQSNTQSFIRLLNFLQNFLWFLLLCPVALLYSSVIDRNIITSYGLSISSFLLLVSFLLAIKNKKSLQITLTDLLITGYMGYIILNSLFIRPHPVPDIFWLNLFSVILIYISVRLMNEKQKNQGLIIILAFGLLETILILLQSYGLVESKHFLFNNTGSFYNPGLTGGFIAFSLCILIYYFVNIKERSKRIYLFIAIFLSTYALILTNSRAGWLAALIGILYIFWNIDNKLINTLKNKLKNSWLLKTLIIIIVVSGSFFMYHHKKSSADGRLFIWENSLSMLKDKPITGHGIGMFRGKYNYYQADYFIKNPDSNKSMVAGNPSNPFNEYVSALTMQGLIGLAFLIGIFLSIFLYKAGSLFEKRKRAFLLSFCVFAFFSYPTSYYRLLILLPFFVGILPIKVVFSISNQKRKYIGFAIISLILLGTLYYSVKMINEYDGLSNILHSYDHSHSHNHEHSHDECCSDCVTECSHDDYTLQITDKQFEKIKYDIVLFQNYYSFVVDKLSDEEKFMLIKDYVELYPSSYGFCELGRMYKLRKDYPKAKECFTMAYYINPSLITPNYELFLLYQEIGDTKNMIEIGNKALTQPLKKEGTETITIKTNIKNILNNLSIDYHIQSDVEHL